MSLASILDKYFKWERLSIRMVAASGATISGSSRFSAFGSADGIMTAGSNILQSASISFVPGDVGKIAIVRGAGTPGVNTSVTANISTGFQTVTPASMTGIIPNMVLLIDVGSNQEPVTVIGVTSTTFSATFVNSHTGPVTVTGNSTALVTTISSVTNSITALLGANAGTTVQAAAIDIGVDDTSAVVAAVMQNSSDGSNNYALAGGGVYLIQPNGVSIPNPTCGILEGNGSSFKSMIRSANPNSSDAVLILGDGASNHEPHDLVIRNLTIDANYGPLGVYLNRTNLFGLESMVIMGIGPGGTGMSTPVTPELFQEMIFSRLSIYGVGDQPSGVPVNSIGALIYATGNVSFRDCNIENVQDGLVFYGSTQARLLIVGGRWERINRHSLILNCCQPTIDLDQSSGDVWLGSDVVGGSVRLGGISGAWANGTVTDNGFGNQIIQPGARPLVPGSGASFPTGVNFRGDEWLSVQGISPDPLFVNGVSAWAANAGAVLNTTPVCMPGIPYTGAGMQIYSAAGGGYASRTFTAQANTDYLLQVGILVTPGASYKIQVANSLSTVYDSGIFSPMSSITENSTNFQAFQVFRKSIPVTSDTTFTVKIFSMNALQNTIVSLVLISASAIQMASDMATTGTGFTTTGSGVSLVWNQDTRTGQVYTVLSNSLQCRSYIRFVATVPANVQAFAGVKNNANVVDAGPIVTLQAGVSATEYVVPLMSYPFDSQVMFYSFLNGGVVNISEVGVYPIDDIPSQLASMGYGIVRSDPANGVTKLTASNNLVQLGDYFSPNVLTALANMQQAASSGNGFTRASFGSNIYWDETSGKWILPINGSSAGNGDFGSMVFLPDGDIAFVNQFGLTLPTTLTNTQFQNQIRLRIVATNSLGTGADATFALYNSGGTEQMLIMFGSGSPQGVVNASTGCIYSDISNGVLWYSTGGGTGNWFQISFGVWSVYTPTFTPPSGMSGGSTGFDASYSQLGKTVTVRIYLASTLSGTPASPLTLSLPVTPLNSVSTELQSLSCIALQIAGPGPFPAAATVLGFANSDVTVYSPFSGGTFPAARINVAITGSYQAA